MHWVRLSKIFCGWPKRGMKLHEMPTQVWAITGPQNFCSCSVWYKPRSVLRASKIKLLLSPKSSFQRPAYILQYTVCFESQWKATSIALSNTVLDLRCDYLFCQWVAGTTGLLAWPRCDDEFILGCITYMLVVPGVHTQTKKGNRCKDCGDYHLGWTQRLVLGTHCKRTSVFYILTICNWRWAYCTSSV